LANTPAWLDRANDGLSLVFAIPLIYQIPHLFRRSGIHLYETGITENLSTFKENHFPWSQMIRIRFAKVFFMKYLLIDIQNPKEYIQKQNLLHKWPMMTDMKNFGTPVKVPIYTLQKKPEEILYAIYDLHQRILAPLQPQTPPEGNSP
jgi:hypothetical protein